jgi:hypothetical protein
VYVGDGIGRRDRRREPAAVRTGKSVRGDPFHAEIARAYAVSWLVAADLAALRNPA